MRLNPYIVHVGLDLVTYADTAKSTEEGVDDTDDESDIESPGVPTDMSPRTASITVPNSESQDISDMSTKTARTPIPNKESLNANMDVCGVWMNENRFNYWTKLKEHDEIEQLITDWVKKHDNSQKRFCSDKKNKKFDHDVNFWQNLNSKNTDIMKSAVKNVICNIHNSQANDYYTYLVDELEKFPLAVKFQKYLLTHESQTYENNLSKEQLELFCRLIPSGANFSPLIQKISKYADKTIAKFVQTEKKFMCTVSKMGC